MRSTFLAVAAATALLAGCGLGAPDYPSFTENAYRIEGMTAAPDGGASTRTVIYRDGPKMRVEAMLPEQGQATIVFDESTNAAYVLNPTGQAQTAPTPTATPAATATSPSPTATPSTASPAPTTGAPASTVAPAAAPAPQVIGVAVRIDDTDAPQPLEAAWSALGADNARSTGKCEVAGENGHEWTPRSPDAAGVERTACITDDGIVLRVRENERVLWEATSLQRGEQDAALFGLPPGYQVIDPQAVAEGVGERMEQLDSVTGAPQAPTAPAPAPRTN